MALIEAGPSKEEQKKEQLAQLSFNFGHLERRVEDWERAANTLVYDLTRDERNPEVAKTKKLLEDAQMLFAEYHMLVEQLRSLAK